jgi:hypothetical protein
VASAAPGTPRDGLHIVDHSRHPHGADLSSRGFQCILSASTSSFAQWPSLRTDRTDKGSRLCDPLSAYPHTLRRPNMDLINTILAVTALWLAGGILAGVMVGSVVAVIWWIILGIRRLLRQMA